MKPRGKPTLAGTLCTVCRTAEPGAQQGLGSRVGSRVAALPGRSGACAPSEVRQRPCTRSPPKRTQLLRARLHQPPEPAARPRQRLASPPWSSSRSRTPSLPEQTPPRLRSGPEWRKRSLPRTQPPWRCQSRCTARQAQARGQPAQPRRGPCRPGTFGAARVEVGPRTRVHATSQRSRRHGRERRRLYRPHAQEVQRGPRPRSLAHPSPSRLPSGEAQPSGPVR